MSTGRFFVHTKSGRKFCVEPYGDPHIQWGNINPATKKLEKVESKQQDVIDDSNTFITHENGFKHIHMLSPGTSPMAFIDYLDNSGIEKIEEENEFVKYIP